MATSRDASTQDGAGTATEHAIQQALLPLQNFVPLNELLIEVEFNRGMWWTMPSVLSTPILTEWYSGATEVSFVWDWGNDREGSYRPDGEATSINRYILNFNTMMQRNIDNDRARNARVVHIVR